MLSLKNMNHQLVIIFCIQRIAHNKLFEVGLLTFGAFSYRFTLVVRVLELMPSSQSL